MFKLSWTTNSPWIGFSLGQTLHSVWSVTISRTVHQMMYPVKPNHFINYIMHLTCMPVLSTQGQNSDKFITSNSSFKFQLILYFCNNNQTTIIICSIREWQSLHCVCWYVTKLISQLSFLQCKDVHLQAYIMHRWRTTHVISHDPNSCVIRVVHAPCPSCIPSPWLPWGKQNSPREGHSIKIPIHPVEGKTHQTK